MISDEVRAYAERSVLCWLATASAGGVPNVSPKEVFVLQNDELLIANIASPKSVRNIRENSSVCVSFIDIFVQKGFKLVGIARFVPPTAEAFAFYAAPLQKKAGDAFAVRGVIAVTVQEVTPIIAPSYRFYPSTTEEAQIGSAYQTYGVKAKDAVDERAASDAGSRSRGLG